MLCILVLFVLVQILFHSSLSALVVEADRSWCEIGTFASFVRSVVASLAEEFFLVWRTTLVHTLDWNLIIPTTYIRAQRSTRARKSGKFQQIFRVHFHIFIFKILRVWRVFELPLILSTFIVAISVCSQGRAEFLRVVPSILLGYKIFKDVDVTQGKS